MAQIERRSPTKWRARIRRLGHRDLSKSFRTRDMAERWARQIENEIDRGVFVDRAEAERKTMGDLFRKYRAEVTPSKRGWQSETCRLTALCKDDLAAIKVAKLTTAKLAAWRDKRLETVSGSTVLRDLNLIGHVIQTARREWEIALPENPVRLVRKPRANPARERRLSTDEETRLFSALDVSDNRAQDGTLLPNTARNPWLAPIVELALETAMRQGELVSLAWSNIDLERRTAILTLTKNGERRVVPLSSRAIALLRGLPEPHKGEVFPSVTTEAVKRGFARAVKRAEIEDFHFHDLRHEATSRIFEKGLNPLEVASITGHKTLQMLKRYTHFRAEELARKLG